MNLFKKIFKINDKKIVCIFKENEMVDYFDGKQSRKVKIQGIWKDIATIIFDDNNKLNINIKKLSKIKLCSCGKEGINCEVLNFAESLKEGYYDILCRDCIKEKCEQGYFVVL